MKVGLIDVDSHNFPNLALMRISAYHKSLGDDVDWWWGIDHYDVVYMSKVFSNTYSTDIRPPLNADKVIMGGTGYCITTDENGFEHFDRSKNNSLPPEIEKMFPDYSIYPKYDFAVAMTSRGCPRGCGFCHVVPKEGRCSIKVADVSDFWCGQKEIQVLDPNITACKDKHDLFMQYAQTGAAVDFNQGLDIRLLTEEDLNDLSRIKLKNIHFAWDNPKDDLGSRFEWYASHTTHKPKGSCGTVYILTNYEKCSVEEHVTKALYRINILRDLKYDPYLMIYNKPSAPKVLRDMQRWCNDKRLFKAVKSFDLYKRKVELQGQTGLWEDL